MQARSGVAVQDRQSSPFATWENTGSCVQMSVSTSSHSTWLGLLVRVKESAVDGDVEDDWSALQTMATMPRICTSAAAAAWINDTVRPVICGTNFPKTAVASENPKIALVTSWPQQ